MEVFHPLQIATLALQCFLVTLVITTLFWLRKWLGFSLLYAAIGIMQYMKVSYSHTFYIEILPGISVAPASVFFVGTLFTILLLYIREDADSARNVIYAVIITNVLLLVFHFAIWLGIETAYGSFQHKYDPTLFSMGPRVAIIGTILLFLDAIGIIVLYEYFSRFTRSLFWRVFISMTAILIFDSLFLSFGVFYESNKLHTIILASVVSKSLMGLCYSVYFTVYLVVVEKRMFQPEKTGSFKDFFHFLTYRQRFEQLDYRSNVVLETMTDGLIIVARNMEIIEVNEAYCKLSGYKEEELIGMDVSELDLKYSPEKVQEFKEAAMAGENLRFETRHKTKEGNILFLDISVVLMELNGEKHAAAFCRDITEAKLRELVLEKNAERWNIAEKIAGFGSFSYELSTGKVEGSEEFYAISGLCKDLHVKNLQTIAPRVHPDDFELFLGLPENLINPKASKNIIEISFRYLLPNGNERWLELNMEPIFGAEDRTKPSMYLGAIIDIHERKLTEEKLKVNLEMQRLAADISRDFVLAKGEEIDRAILQALEKISLTLGMDHAALNRVNDTFVTVTHEWDINNDVFWGEEYQGYDTSEFKFLWEKLNDSEPFLISDLDEHKSDADPLISLLKNLDTKSFLAIPLVPDQKVIGTLTFSSLATSPVWEEDIFDIFKFLSSAFSSIIQRRKQGLALKESEARFRAIFEQASVGVALSNKNTGDIIKTNPKFCEILGYTEYELTSLNIFDITHPDDKKRIKEFGEKLIKENLPSGSIEKRYVKKSGEIVWANLSVSQLLLDNGKPEYYIGVVEDITESKMLNDWRNLNASVLEKTAKGLKLVDVTSEITNGIDALIPGVISSISLVNKDYLIIPSPATKLPETWLEYITPNEVGPKNGCCGAACYHKKMMVAEDIETDFRWANIKEEAKKYGFKSCWAHPIISADGKEALGAFCLYFKTNRSPVNIELKIINSVASMLALVIEKHKAEAELIKHQNNLERLVKVRTADLEKANEELRSFSYSVSHDLRAPLTRINGFSKVLENKYVDKLDEKGAHYLQRIRASSQHMATLIDDILVLSKVSRQTISISHIPISNMVKEILKQLQESAPERNAKINVEEGLFINMDEGLASLMMRNLLNNAWKYSGKSEVSEISFGTCNRRGESWFFVRDNGIGFDMKYYDQLFRPFQRLYSENDINGTGIGLATVQRIIEKHGGKIEAESTEGAGASFYFSV